jgi:hypothetical protein
MNLMTMKNFLLPALAVVGIALTSAKTKADDGFGVRAEPDYYGSYYYPDYSYGPDGYYYYQTLFLRRLAPLASSPTLACE